MGFHTRKSVSILHDVKFTSVKLSVQQCYMLRCKRDYYQEVPQSHNHILQSNPMTTRNTIPCLSAPLHFAHYNMRCFFCFVLFLF